jgi:transmembrane sensor
MMKKQAEHTTGNLLYSNLEKYQSIDVEKDWEDVREKAGLGKRKKVSLLWRVAAIAIVILGIGFLSKQYILAPDLLFIETNEKHTEILLPDGSLVHLNSHSRLTYPEKFRRSRQVSLNGEGFFEVKRDPQRPFLVSINALATVEVLGTSFNVNAPKEDQTVKVQVVEGKVSFSANKQNGTGTILLMNEQAVLKDGEILKDDRPNRNFLSWKTGIINFEQEKVSRVLDILSSYYNREFIMEHDVDKDLVFTSTIDNQELEDVLEELSLVLELKITYNPDAITISKQY